MPLYNFKCSNPKCGEKFEQIVANTNVSAVQCPKCATLANKQISTFGGYGIKGNNSGSVTPKGAGSRSK